MTQEPRNDSAFTGDLLGAFRTHYSRFEHAVREVMSNPTDSTVLARLGDDLDEFARLAIAVSNVITIITIVAVKICSPECPYL
jgi:hypothetical protein